VPIALSARLGYSGFIVDTAFASVAVQPEALPAIYNAWLLVGLPVSLFGKAVANRSSRNLPGVPRPGDWLGTRRALLGALTASVVLALPSVLALIVLGRPTIRILFEHGRFDTAAGSLTDTMLTDYAVGLPAYIALEVVVRGPLRASRYSDTTSRRQRAARRSGRDHGRFARAHRCLGGPARLFFHGLAGDRGTAVRISASNSTTSWDSPRFLECCLTRDSEVCTKHTCRGRSGQKVL